MDAGSRLYRLLAGLAFLLYLVPATAPAVTGQELFEAEVPVSSQQPAERAPAVAQALSEVLVRVTGQRELMQQRPFPRGPGKQPGCEGHRGMQDGPRGQRGQGPRF